MTILNPPFPEVIDSTFMSAFRACPYKAYLAYIEHWKRQYQSVDLAAGGAFAKGIEVARKAFYELNMPAQEAEAHGLKALMESYGDFECPDTSPKTLDRMIGALEFYYFCYPLGNDGAIPITIPGTGRRGIEFSFLEPLEIAHPTTGAPLLFAGRADMIADFAGGCYGFDEKTTTQLGQKWAGQWDLRSQFTSYSWAAKRSEIPIQGTIVRGVSILKTKYDTAQAITYRADWELERWEEQLYKDLRRLIQMWQAQEYVQNLDGSCTRMGNPWDRSLDAACNDYGGCQFKEVCKAKHPYSILESEFERRVWDPVTHREVSIEEWEAGQNA